MAFLNAVLAITDPGDEVILPIPFYFNHEMALTMIGCRAVGVRTDARYQLDLAALRAAITAAHASDRHHLAEQSDRRGVSRGGSARRECAVCGARHRARHRRGVRVLHVRRRAALLAGTRRGEPGTHDLAVLAVQGVRLRELAHRLHGRARRAVRCRQQDPGHEPDLPAAGVPGRCRGGAAGRPAVLRAPRGGARRRPSRSARDADGDRGHRGGAGDRGRVLRAVAGAHATSMPSR